jgi:prepilin-type N-terminal cleavage/methylation domain-containing protein
MNIKSQKGFTLIELMIASSLLMLVMYSGYFAYSLYSTSWKKQSNAFWQSADKGVNLTSLTRVIEAAHPYVVEDVNNNLSIYFIGTPKVVRFISKSPIFTDGPAVVELRLINSELIYKESDLNKAPLLKQIENRDWQHSVVLLKHLNLPRFNFFGWNGIQHIQRYEQQLDGLLRGEGPITPALYNKHQMEGIRLLPLALNLNYTVKGGEELLLPFSLPHHSQHVLFSYIGAKA